MQQRILGVLYVLVALIVRAENADAVQLRVDFPRSEIVSQSILAMKVSVLFDESELEGDFRLVLDDEDIKVRFIDSHGQDVGVLPPLEWRCPSDLNALWSVDAVNVAEQSKLFLLNKWRTTKLPIGKYCVAVEISRARMGVKGAEPYKRTSIAGRKLWETEVTISSDSPAMAAREYALALERVKEALITQLTPQRMVEGFFDNEAIIYSREPAAAPYQYEFLTGRVRVFSGNSIECQLSILAENLIQADRPEVARALVDWIESKPKSDDMQRLNRFKDRILWIIHEMHKRGNPEIVKITAKTVSEYPQPRDPRPRPGMD